MGGDQPLFCLLNDEIGLSSTIQYDRYENVGALSTGSLHGGHS